MVACDDVLSPPTTPSLFTIEQADQIIKLDLEWKDAQDDERRARSTLEAYVQEVTRHYPGLTHRAFEDYMQHARQFHAGITAMRKQKEGST